MRRPLLYAGALALAAALAGGVSWVFTHDTNPAGPSAAGWSLETRPAGEHLLYDYAGILTHFDEGINRYLKRIAEDFHIEAVLLTLPDLAAGQSIDGLAADVLSQWRIGGNYEGRAVLLLLVAEPQEVRLEVAYELEDVFTDAFVGFVEDKQLKPYFLDGDVGTGLIALMEELERRAELKHKGGYTPELIARLDTEFLSGGAGAGRDLKQYARQTPARPSESGQKTPTRGARTPEEAWRGMLAMWAGRGADFDIEVYTELTRMAMGDPRRPDPRTREALPHWQDAPFRVLEDGDHAVIYFGYKKGWDNAPFLFCHDGEGWKFDIVHQRRLVVMGNRQSWFVEQGRFPYVSLLREVPQSTGKDLPLSADDRYRCRDDDAVADRIRALTAQLDKDPDDYPALQELMRLSVITGRRPNHVQPLIRRAQALAPEDPHPYKYAAIYNVNTFFQYDTALKDIAAYLERGGEPVFGYSVKGFLHYRLEQYDRAVEALHTALASAPGDVYVLTLLARVYALRHLKAGEADPRRGHFRDKAIEYLRRAQNTPTDDGDRVARITRWMRSKGLI